MPRRSGRADQDPGHLLALAVRLKSFQRLGYFPKTDDVPPAVVRHVRECLGLAEDVEFGLSAKRTGIGPASGSDTKIRDALGRYVLTAFAYGTLLGPAQVAAHMRGQVSVHELTLAGNKHAAAAKIEKASATVINAFAKLDVTAMWGSR
jgi:hypothetical protein